MDSSSITYGFLYNWYTVSTNKLCPAGWHVPSDAEWTELADTLGGVDAAGGKLKEIGTKHWQDPNAGATDETGFTALPGGFRLSNGKYDRIGFSGVWWSSTESDFNILNAWCWIMTYDESFIERIPDSKRRGFSVRCIKD
jgi:uncharacterized protein (TIGR02145 family)